MIASRNTQGGGGGPRRRSGFTLIELLVTISIIGLLMAILVPSLKGSRDAAKRAVTQNALKEMATGLTMFKNDNEKRNVQTNGYPASAKAEDRASVGSQDIYGAHWLVRSLLGKDFAGFIPRRIVPPALQDIDNETEEQVRWYAPEPNDPVIDRIEPYVTPERLKTALTESLPGTPPSQSSVYPLPSDPVTAPTVRHLPVFVDAWGFPILYYAASSFGKVICNVSSGAGQRVFFDHEDNEIFTGSVENSIDSWVFKGRQDHLIKEACPSNLEQIDDTPTFARYIHNERMHQQFQGPASAFKPRPYRQKSFLLISAGADGKYGNTDDVNNFGN